MAALKVCASLGATLLAFVTAPAHADDVERWRPLIDEASASFGVPVTWIEQVMKVESHGMTMWHGRPITSRVGAMGLMQLMPATWAAMRARLGLGSDPYAPRDNILAGTYYLRRMYDRFGYPGLFGAYNAGPGRYRKYLATGRQLPSETVAYMAATAHAAVTPAVTIARAGRPLAVPRQNTIFFETGLSSRPTPSARASIFVVLRGPVAPSAD